MGLIDRKKHPSYSVWNMMRARCYTPSATGYAHYGGRGISVCERWKSFEAFIEDMGPRPSTKHTLERRDGKLPYEPSNCYWASKTEQSRNRPGYNRLNIEIVRKLRRRLSEGATGAELAREFGCAKSTVYAVRDNQIWKEEQ